MQISSPPLLLILLLRLLLPSPLEPELLPSPISSMNISLKYCVQFPSYRIHEKATHHKLPLHTKYFRRMSALISAMGAKGRFQMAWINGNSNWLDIQLSSPRHANSNQFPH
ncbi:hypothetical protein AVEN_181689-1 [Araneus ventricosus]|uniref:Uncharacterized protein n=1 Tax=Araneus ventricosus TaxID=182803 RepID=A0A4Y2MPV0_ARAVE|nr:hypothetical protein AVEN_181689-1 [Araneus ventricosus]